MNYSLRQMSNSSTVLVVDDDPAMRIALTESLKLLGYDTEAATSGEEALAYLNEKPVGTILTDMQMGGMTGIDLFHKVNKYKIPVIIMSAYGTIDAAVMAMKSGVVDYLVKPFSQERLDEAVKKGLASVPSAAEKSASPIKGRMTAMRTILTNDPGMLKLLKMTEVVASSDATIFLEGESGTGKEVFARFIHEHSPRAHRPFIAINCAAVPENLLESELFGHEKGAFTGALIRKPGKFELAHTGTILLDEVSEMHLSLQAKLLRVLQEKEVDSVGGREPIPLDIRVIATTNRPILKEVEEGRFREDLYYRLNVFPLHIPPLRDRITDIPLLAEYFIKKIAARNHQEPVKLSSEALSQLLARPWKGNVRELENAMERACLLASLDKVILPEHLGFTEPMKKEPVVHNGSANGAEKMTLWEVERDLILDTLEKMGGNRTHAAKRLGISIRTMRNKLKEYRSAGLLDPEEDEEASLEEEEVGKFFPAMAKSGN
jgi:two-component system response regulator FlrC